jgi:hypothetical protein
MNDTGHLLEQRLDVLLVANIFSRIEVFMPEVDLDHAGAHRLQEPADGSADKAGSPRDKNRLIPHFATHPRKAFNDRLAGPGKTCCIN